MFCPRCSQEQITEDVRFCSRCGFLMTGVSQLLANNGNLQHYSAQTPGKMSPRKKGLRQGGLMLILGTFIVPFFGVLNAPDALLGALALIFFLGGILRMIYAAIFQSNMPQENSLTENLLETAQKVLPKKFQKKELAAQQTYPVTDYITPTVGNWRNTNDLTPHSVTDNTTKLLQKDE